MRVRWIRAWCKSMASLAGEYEVVLVARSDGLMNADIRPLVRLSVAGSSLKLTVSARQARQAAAGALIMPILMMKILRKYAAQAVHQAAINLDARPAPAGNMDSGTGQRAGRVFCCTKRLDMAWKATSTARAVRRFPGASAKRVAAPGVTVVDDGTLAQRRGSLQMDDEGNATQSTTLIEDGILTGYLQEFAQCAANGRAGYGQCTP